MRKRPVNLDLTTFQYPYPAITSILHRVCGVLLFLATPVFLWLWDLSLRSPDGFATVKALLSIGWFKLFLWASLSALVYHLLAGIRHLLIDGGFGEELSSARVTAVLTIACGVVFSLLIGVWLW